MRFSTRSKVSVLLSLVTTIAIVCAFMVTIFSHGQATHAASASGMQAVASTTVKAATVNPLKLSTSQGASGANHAIPYRSTHLNSTSARSGNAPHAAGVLTSSLSHLPHNFNGVSTVDSANVNGFDVEPPTRACASATAS